MRFGKLDSLELSAVLSLIKSTRSEVIVGSQLGKDCALLRLEGDILVTSDPITAKCERPGYLAMHVTANDIFAGGGVPICATMTILAPPNATVLQISNVMTDGESVARELGFQIVGGHTEFTDAVARTIVSVTMIGKSVAKFAKIKAGDDIVLSKSLAQEGALILADKLAGVLQNEFSQEELAQLKSFDISVRKESKVAAEVGVAAMHDITEGGVFGAVAELCGGAGFGAEIWCDSLPILPTTQKICDKFGLDICYLLSSGSMLMITDNADKLCRALGEEGVSSQIIGRVSEKEKGLFALKDGKKIPLEIKSDEIYKV